MKKVVLNISDCDYEKLKFESIHERKSIQDLIKERLWFKKFHPDVIESYHDFMQESFEKIGEENVR